MAKMTDGNQNKLSFFTFSNLVSVMKIDRIVFFIIFMSINPNKRIVGIFLK